MHAEKRVGPVGEAFLRLVLHEGEPLAIRHPASRRIVVPPDEPQPDPVVRIRPIRTGCQPSCRSPRDPLTPTATRAIAATIEARWPPSREYHNAAAAKAATATTQTRTDSNVPAGVRSHRDPPASNFQRRGAREDRDPCATVPQQLIDSRRHQEHKREDGEERNVSLDFETYSQPGTPAINSRSSGVFSPISKRTAAYRGMNPRRRLRTLRTIPATISTGATIETKRSPLIPSVVSRAVGVRTQRSVSDVTGGMSANPVDERTVSPCANTNGSQPGAAAATPTPIESTETEARVRRSRADTGVTTRRYSASSVATCTASCVKRTLPPIRLCQDRRRRRRPRRRTAAPTPVPGRERRAGGPRGRRGPKSRASNARPCA